MRLRRNQRPDGVARLQFFADESGTIDAVSPSWDGDLSTLMHLPAAAFDEFVAYAYPPDGVLRQMEAFLLAASRSNEIDEWLWEAPSLLVEVPNVSPAAVVTTSIGMDFEKQRLWSRTSYEPKQTRNLLLPIAPRIYWNWVVNLVEGEIAALESLSMNLAHQLDYYGEVGVASDFFLKNIGKAPFYGAMKGSGERLSEEIADSAGLTVDAFRELPESEREAIIARHSEQTADEWRAMMLKHFDQG